MKTAEEIIFGLGYYPSKKGSEEGRLIVKAMNEYAVQFMNFKDCYQCNGTGIIQGGIVTCMNCIGAGKYVLLPTITTTGT